MIYKIAICLVLICFILFTYSLMKTSSNSDDDMEKLLKQYEKYQDENGK